MARATPLTDLMLSCEPPRGFSLLEAALAISLASMIGLGTLSLLDTMHRTKQTTRARSEASAIARDTLDTVLSLTSPTSGGAAFDAMLKSPASPFSLGTVSTSADLSTGGTWTASASLPGPFTRELTLAHATGDPDSLLTLTVDVSFQQGTQTRHVVVKSKVLR
ncbi:MAG: hypothetical protein HY904_06445 [Deltaproteobacteria bacterium]|nr:hypothetical protein [Deltaproteobacteria bacterium]